MMQHLSEREILSALSAIDETDNRWRVFISILHRFRENAIAEALVPGLSDSDRAYNNGRASMAHDTWAECQIILEKAKKLNEQPDQQSS